MAGREDDDRGRRSWRDKDDRERGSWREIDKKRDQSLHIDRSDPYARPGRPRGQRPNPTAGYRAALDKVFEGGALPDKFKALASAKQGDAGTGSKRQALLRAVRDADDRQTLAAATADLLAMDGELPDDADVLISVLRHPDEAVVRDAIRALGKLASSRPLKRKELLKQRLRQVEELAEEEETRVAGAELRKALG